MYIVVCERHGKLEFARAQDLLKVFSTNVVRF